jgi:hypothetical protein
MGRKQALVTRISDNFFAHVDQSGGPDACWPYQRCKNAKGYGRVWVDKKCHEAHRYAFMLAKGPIPTGLCILHSCDFPSCCNPAHLRIGTKYENAMDREVRNRGNQPKGEDNANSKLTTRDVIFIRRCQDIYNSYQMASMLGVQNGIISKVLRGEQWSHVIEITPLGDAAVQRDVG